MVKRETIYKSYSNTHLKISCAFFAEAPLGGAVLATVGAFLGGESMGSCLTTIDRSSVIILASGCGAEFFFALVAGAGGGGATLNVESSCGEGQTATAAAAAFIAAVTGFTTDSTVSQLFVETNVSLFTFGSSISTSIWTGAGSNGGDCTDGGTMSSSLSSWEGCESGKMSEFVK